MKSLLDEADHEAMHDRTDLVPLIDCVFLVLLFYVLAATFTEEGAFPVVLPRTAGTEEATKVAAVVELAQALPIQAFSLAVERPDSAAPPAATP